MTTPALTFFTVANGRYEPFVLPYLTSVLWSNPTASVEIRLPDPRTFADANRTALGLLQRCYPSRVALLGGDFGRTTVNSLRFLEEPRTVAPYLYIGDIDILVLEEVAPIHLDSMARTGLPYSNILRPGKPAMSGLHFTVWDAHVPLTAPPAGSKINLDEGLLHDLVVARGLPLPDPDEVFRPLHGFHLSLNCDPRVRGRGWGGINHLAYVSAFLHLQQSEVWTEIAPMFDHRYRRLLALLETALGPHLPADFTPTPGTDLKTLW